MHIEVWKTGTSKQPWHWHFKNGSRITADAEAFPSKAHAIRAAKAVVRAVVKHADGSYIAEFVMKEGKDGKTIIRWIGAGVLT